MAVDHSARVGSLKFSGGRAGAFHFINLYFSIIPYHQGLNTVKCSPPESGRAGGPAHIFQPPGHSYCFLQEIITLFDLFHKNHRKLSNKCFSNLFAPGRRLLLTPGIEIKGGG